MNLFKVLAFALTLGVSANISARNTEGPDSQKQYFKIDNNEVVIDFMYQPGSDPVGTQQRLIFTPEIVSGDSLHILTLKPIVILGRVRDLKEQREGTADREGLYLRLRDKDLPEDGIYYTTRLPYETWMDDASMYFREKVEGCADCGISDDTELFRDPLLYPAVLNISDETECPVEYTPRSGECDAFLIYPVNSSILSTNVATNRRELAKIDSVLNFVEQNPAYAIQKMEITGYASPEAPYNYNVWLGERRSEALKSYLLKNHNVPDTLLKVTPGAENWDDLVVALKKSNISHKEEILNIIETEGDYDFREERIKRIDGGRPYLEMLNTMYPALRKNTFVVSYISLERPVDEAHELVFSNPSELNVYEFYKVAQTYYSENPEMYRKVIMIAADTYPGHSIANNNAARAALQEGDLAKAYDYLLNTRNEDFTLGNRAYLAWKEGRIADAVALWTKAADKGDEVAAKNVSEIKKRGY